MLSPLVHLSYLIPLPVFKKFCLQTILFVFIILFFVNILAFSLFTKKEKLILKTARFPFLPNSHLQLSNYLFENNNLTRAEVEVKIIENSSLLSFILKIPSLNKYYLQTKTIITKPNKIGMEINAIEKVLINKPFYRDLLLKKSLLHWKMWTQNSAEESLKKASYLDPNNPKVKKLEELIYPN